jgi:tetratricopeptide (TPR) repeat protein
MSYYLKGI